MNFSFIFDELTLEMTTWIILVSAQPDDLTLFSLSCNGQNYMGDKKVTIYLKTD